MIRPCTTADVSFRLQSDIGHEGKQSEVWLAHDVQLDAQLVMKRIPVGEFSNPDEYFTEASILYAGQHPNVVPIHYACKDNDHIYLAMPYYVNGSVNSVVNARFLTVREVIRLGTQFLSGLQNIHSKGLIHFDIKPDNILLSSRYEALLADFGLARYMTHSGFARRDRIYGKMAPPERFSASTFSAAFDIYQAGLTLYRMCVGNRSFYDQLNKFVDANGDLDRDVFRHAIVNGRFPDRQAFPPHIPRGLRDAVRKCLEVDPVDRYSAPNKIVNDFCNIDEAFYDWQYEVTVDNGERWTKLKDRTTYVLEVTKHGESKAHKTTKSGRQYRLGDFCINSISKTKIREFLKGQ